MFPRPTAEPMEASRKTTSDCHFTLPLLLLALLALFATASLPLIASVDLADGGSAVFLRLSRFHDFKTGIVPLSAAKTVALLFVDEVSQKERRIQNSVRYVHVGYAHYCASLG